MADTAQAKLATKIRYNIISQRNLSIFGRYSVKTQVIIKQNRLLMLCPIYSLLVRYPNQAWLTPSVWLQKAVLQEYYRAPTQVSSPSINQICNISRKKSFKTRHVLSNVVIAYAIILLLTFKMQGINQRSFWRILLKF